MYLPVADLYQYLYIDISISISITLCRYRSILPAHRHPALTLSVLPVSHLSVSIVCYYPSVPVTLRHLLISSIDPSVPYHVSAPLNFTYHLLSMPTYNVRVYPSPSNRQWHLPIL